MDSDFEELESLYSDHFGRTPLTTPQASQEESVDNVRDFNVDGTVIENQIIQEAIDARVSGYLNQININSSNDNSDTVFNSENAVNEELDEDICTIEKFKKSGCGCNNDCSNHLDVQKTFYHILSVREMIKDEKDLYLIGSIANECDEEKTKRGKKRKRVMFKYKYNGRAICKKTFMLVYDIGRHSLEALVKHMKTEGITPRKHGNTGKKPKHALAFEDVKRVVQFIQNFADTYGLPQPAAPRGCDNLPAIFLESGLTKLQLHKDYLKVCEESSVRSVKASCFSEIWKNCVPHIKIASPRDDVCALCEKHRQTILIAVEEAEKLEAVEQFREHVLIAQKERELYNHCVKKAKETCELGPRERFNHYTFDFSQNVSIPHFSRQMGPMYFTSLRKIQIFGVRIDGQSKQLNFLIDEDETIGIDGSKSHGPNAVISMLDHILNTYGRDEHSISLHADNCPGQNKNQFMIGYLLWRVLTGQQDRIDYLMQVPGHAKCLFDSGFGHLKKLYRRSNIETLDELTSVVEKSSKTNESIRYPAWQWRDWKTHLQSMFRPIPGVRKYQSFKMSKDERGVVAVKTQADGPEEFFVVLKIGKEVDETLPPIIQSSGLSQQRANYLYKTVRPYISEAAKDITCPLPEVDN